MRNFRISIQDKVKAFDENGLVGEATIEEIEDFCKEENIEFPSIWNEQDKKTFEIVEKYFEGKL
jgi:hypothetical protein